jgi:hypothetical protein
VHPVRRDNYRRGEAPAIPGGQRDFVRSRRRLDDVDAGHELGARFDGLRNEKRIEFDAPDEEDGRPIGFDRRGLAAGPLEVQPRHAVSPDTIEIVREIWKSLEHPRADAASTGLVPRERGSIEKTDGDTGPGQCPRRRRTRRTRTDDQHHKLLIADC